MRTSFRFFSVLTAIIVLPVGAERPRLPTPHPDLPAEFRQLLERGKIASVDEPQFVSASDAKISDDAWVLGVTISGQPRAYSLNLLNRHEVVNDESAGTKFAAVW